MSLVSAPEPCGGGQPGGQAPSWLRPSCANHCGHVTPTGLRPAHNPYAHSTTFRGTERPWCADHGALGGRNCAPGSWSALQGRALPASHKPSPSESGRSRQPRGALPAARRRSRLMVAGLSESVARSAGPHISIRRILKIPRFLPVLGGAQSHRATDSDPRGSPPT